MRAGIGLPATIPGAEREQVIEWARTAEACGFPSLGVIDRLVYPNWDPVVALSAAAAVTERVELITAIAIAPYRRTAIFAKQVASLDRLSGGRLTVGLGLGARDDDYDAAGVPDERTGARLEQQIEEMQRIWGGEKLGFAGGIGPQPVRPEGVPVIVGGSVKASFRRAARLGEGWIMGGGAPDMFREAADAVREAWRDEGRDGAPRLMALAYFALGDDARERADSYIHDYYGIMGEEGAGQIAASVAVSEEMVQQYIGAFEQAGCDDLILFPCSTDVDQVKRLAAAVQPVAELTPAR